LRIFLDGKLVLGGRPHAASQSSVYSTAVPSAGNSPTVSSEQGRLSYLTNEEVLKSTAEALLQELEDQRLTESHGSPHLLLLRMMCAVLRHGGG
jgi:hypothetical protein